MHIPGYYLGFLIAATDLGGAVSYWKSCPTWRYLLKTSIVATFISHHKGLDSHIRRNSSLERFLNRSLSFEAFKCRSQA
jgi:hypothetical protein